MKKNGFTLVEMMAVIVLVAVLAVIGVATYTGVNESAKRKTLESKKEEIRTSAIKWAKENEITSKTLISVNALVVEGYLTADENRIGEIGLIENPVTGENMICNTVDISFKQGEMVAEVDDKVQNCDLATQSLIDDNIGIKVVDEAGYNKTGSGSIANWTNKNVAIVVSSDEYDRDAVSISFDFEGNTTTKQVSGLQKYTGNGYINKDDAPKYYNVFNVEANLILNNKVIVTYKLSDGTIKSRAYTIRIDKEEATASVKSNNEWLTVDKPIYVAVDDGKGSGPKYFYVTSSPTEELKDSNKYTANYEGTATNLDVGKYYIWTEDNAGNRSTKYKMILEVNNVDKTIPECEVIFDGTIGDHGWFKENPVQPYGHNTVPAGISGIQVGVNQAEDVPVYSAYAYYGTDSLGPGEKRVTNTLKEGELYWCHAKTLAGNYANNSKRLYLDVTPPTISVSVTEPNTHTQTKTATVKIQDTLSGLNERTVIKYGFSLSDKTKPTVWHDFVITTSAQNNDLVTGTFTTDDKITGTYYMWFDTSGFTDYAGNHARPSEGSSGNMFVYGPYSFDNTPPKCNGNNGKTYWTKDDYTIEQLCIDNVGTDDQSKCAQDMYSIYYGTDKTVKKDKVTIYDKAHNSTVCDYNVYLDNTPPTCNGKGGKTKWTKGTYTVVQKCKEDNVNQSGCAQPTFSKDYGTSDTYKTHEIIIMDAVGNTTVCPTNVYLDNTPPVCGSTTGESKDWTRSSRTVYVGCSDGTNQSGCSKTLFSKKHSDTTMKDTIDIIDKVGNVTTCGPFNYYVDVTKPVCGANNGKTNWTTGGYNITVNCSDGTNQSGCEQTVWYKAFTELNNVKSSSLTIKDKAGNTQSCSFDVYLDNNNPTCNGNNGKTNWTTGSFTGVQNCKDSYSGCTQESYSKTWTTSTNTDTITIYDNVGHSRNCSINVKLDNDPPTCRSTSSASGWTNKQVTIKGICSDTGGSGCAGQKHSFGGQMYSGTYSMNQFADEQDKWHKPGMVSDNAGNTASCPEVHVQIDRTLPSCGDVTYGADSTSGVSVSIPCTDPGGVGGIASGCVKATYSGTKKSSGSFTIKDTAGNTNTCNYSVSSYQQYSTRSWNTCKKGNKCQSGYDYSGTSCTQGCSSGTFQADCESTTISTCCCKKYNSCKSRTPCEGGWDSWTSYSNGTCSGPDTATWECKERTKYHGG